MYILNQMYIQHTQNKKYTRVYTLKNLLFRSLIELCISV